MPPNVSLARGFIEERAYTQYNRHLIKLSLHPRSSTMASQISPRQLPLSTRWP